VRQVQPAQVTRPRATRPGRLRVPRRPWSLWPLHPPLPSPLMWTSPWRGTTSCWLVTSASRNMVKVLKVGHCVYHSLYGGYLGLELCINSLTILFIIFNPSCKRSNLFLFSFGNICLNVISPLLVYTSEGPIGLLDSGSIDNLKIIKVRCINVVCQ